MLYKKYNLINESMEIMIPSEYSKITDIFNLSANAFCNNDNTVRIDINLGTDLKMNSDEITFKLQEYYLDYKRTCQDFRCKHVVKKKINGYDFGEMVYSSKVYDYGFFNYLIIGSLDDHELVITLQCLDVMKDELDHTFGNIIDSIRIIKKEV